MTLLKNVKRVIQTSDGETPVGTEANPMVVEFGADALAALASQYAISFRVIERIIAPAPGATVHALVSSGAPVSVATAFTQMITPTNARISRSGAGVATVYTVVGTRFGIAQTEDIASNGASDVEGVKVFDVITAWSSDVDPEVNSTLKTGVILGLAQTCVSIDYLGLGATIGANAVAEVGTLNAAKDGFTPTTAPNGTKQHVIRYLVTVAAESV